MKNILRFLGLFILFTVIFTSISLLSMLQINRMNPIHFFVYLLIFTFIFSSLMFIYMKLSERKKLKKIERALKNLSKGEYFSKIFLKMNSSNKKYQITKKIDHLLLSLQEKMILMAQEAVSLNDQDVKMDKETKEEILEQERHRIARELHDWVSQQLFASSMMLSAVNQQEDLLPDTISNQLRLIEDITNESQSEMRALLLHLRPVKLNGKTLKEGIEQLLKELDTKISTRITYEVQDVSVPVSVEDHLFRIVQELLSNVLRHAKAQELELYLKTTKSDSILLRVIDDGVGFDMDEKRSGSYGLNNIKERISSIGGDARIISFKGQGTNVEISVPIGLGGER